MTDERAPETVDPIDVAIDRTREAEERLLDIPVDPPPDPPQLTKAADRVVHRADDLLELASDDADEADSEKEAEKR